MADMKDMKLNDEALDSVVGGAGADAAHGQPKFKVGDHVKYDLVGQIYTGNITAVYFFDPLGMYAYTIVCDPNPNGLKDIQNARETGITLA